MRSSFNNAWSTFVSIMRRVIRQDVWSVIKLFLEGDIDGKDYQKLFIAMASGCRWRFPDKPGLCVKLVLYGLNMSRLHRLFVILGLQVLTAVLLHLWRMWWGRMSFPVFPFTLSGDTCPAAFRRFYGVFPHSWSQTCLPAIWYRHQPSSLHYITCSITLYTTDHAA